MSLKKKSHGVPLCVKYDIISGTYRYETPEQDTQFKYILLNVLVGILTRTRVHSRNLS